MTAKTPTPAGGRLRRAKDDRFRRITDEAAEMIKLTSHLIEALGYARGIYRLYTRDHRLAIEASNDLLRRVRDLFFNRRMVTVDVGLRRFLVYQLPIYEVSGSATELHGLLRHLEIGGITFLEGVDAPQVTEFLTHLAQMTGAERKREWLIAQLAKSGISGIVIEAPLVDDTPKAGEEDGEGGIIQEIRVKKEDRFIEDARRLYAIAVGQAADVMNGTTKPDQLNLRDLNRAAKNLSEHLLRYPDELVAMALACRQDDYDQRHPVNVAIFGGRIAATVFRDEKQLVEFVRIALLYDLGKGHANQPHLDKAGGLTTDEYETMKKHPLISADVLDRVIELDKLAVVVAFEHHLGGDKGYPEAEGHWELNLVTRIIRVAEAFDSLVGNTAHRKPLAPAAAFSRLREEFQGNRRGAAARPADRVDRPVPAGSARHLVDRRNRRGRQTLRTQCALSRRRRRRIAGRAAYGHHPRLAHRRQPQNHRRRALESVPFNPSTTSLPRPRRAGREHGTYRHAVAWRGVGDDRAPTQLS
ncbi:MAG: HD domain-containing protein [Deltaproteobacteria bacterium]|nr:HD domain-containing protein [Deltaproteobacteria bacterium]